MNQSDIQLMCRMNALTDVTTPRKRKNGTFSFVDAVGTSNIRNVYDVYTRSGYILRGTCSINENGQIVYLHNNKAPINPRIGMPYGHNTYNRNPIISWRNGEKHATTYADIRVNGSEQSVLASMFAWMNYKIFMDRKNAGVIK